MTMLNTSWQYQPADDMRSRLIRYQKSGEIMMYLTQRTGATAFFARVKHVGADYVEFIRLGDEFAPTGEANVRIADIYWVGVEGAAYHRNQLEKCFEIPDDPDPWNRLWHKEEEVSDG